MRSPSTAIQLASPISCIAQCAQGLLVARSTRAEDFLAVSTSEMGIDEFNGELMVIYGDLWWFNGD